MRFSAYHWLIPTAALFAAFSTLHAQQNGDEPGDDQGRDQEALQLLIQNDDLVKTGVINDYTNVPMETWESVSNAIDPPDFKGSLFPGNRAPAIEGPATEEPQGDQAYLYQ